MMHEPIDIGLPEQMRFIDHTTHIEIVRKWFAKKFLFLTPFAIFWDALLIFWYGRLTMDSPPMAILFPLIHVGVGVWLTYYVLAGWLNRTHVYVGQGLLGVRHTPLPWPGKMNIETTDIRQLYAKEVTKIHRQPNSVTTTSTIYEVRAVTRSGRNIKIISELETQEQAIFVEQQIEKYLRIEDLPVQGEIPKYRF